MRITSKGQVTIPAKIREQAGLLPHTDVEFVFDGASVRIVRSERTGDHGRGRRLLGRLRGSATVRLSTDEIMALTRTP
jgi:AbrB family looped-hinge helix DNA binding protein